MGEPTNVIQSYDIQIAAAAAATKMTSALDTLEELFSADSDTFDIPELSTSLVDLEEDRFRFNDYTDFESLDSLLNTLALSYDTIGFTSLPPVPSAPEIGLPDGIVNPTIPALEATMPIVELPPAPVINIPSVPVAPNIIDVPIPDAPVFSIPSVPELTDVTIPSISSISIPLFTQTFPEVPDDLLAPTGEFFYEEEEYSSEELIALRDLLLDDLRNGGWGVNHYDEEALFDREVDRATSAGVNNEEATIETMASRGFEIPTGALVGLLRKGQQDTLNEISSANREVSIQRADLIRKSRENVIASSLTLNQTMVTHFGFVQQRVLSAAQSVIDFSLRTFNAKAESYNIRVRAYESYANAWAVQIRGQIAQLEAEKAQIEAESLKIDLNKSQIDAYIAQVRAVGLNIDIYNTEMQAAKIRSDIERNRLLVFNSEVDAHRAIIQSEIAKVGAYTAEVNAQGTRVDLYKTQVDAHTSEVRAAKLTSDVQVQNASIQLDGQRTILLGYEAELRGYRAELATQEAIVEKDQANVAGTTTLYQTRGELLVSKSALMDDEIKFIRQTEETLATLRVAEHRDANDLAVDLIRLKVDQLVTPAEQWQKFYNSIGALTSAVDIEVVNA